ncbi:hypothetical protein RRG08_047457 [Elysia crispata]|uniref:C-type lectin domain-containing protein n=1 Tax=Elysia crispata TaxID=231223 RepID=A0AAE0YUZ8_9GAST|nr:hypothetical protein RRG08_047457 [Elysia crispata]
MKILCLFLRISSFSFLLSNVCYAFNVSCEADYLDVSESGTCVKVNASLTTWDEGRVSCQNDGADLVKILDTGMNSLLGTFINIRSKQSKTPQFPSEVYIGLRWFESEKQYRWLDESKEAGYVHLSLKGSKNTQKRCVTVKRENGVIIKWIVGDCASKRPYVCEKRPKNGRDLCPSEWLPSSPSGTCIKVHRYEKTWKDARDECRSVGADLVTIADHAMNSFIWEQVAFHEKTTYWFGLNDFKENDVLRYLDTVDEVVYTHWDSDQPKKTSASDCGIIVNHNSTGDSKPMSWRVTPCSDTHRFICEKFSDCQNKNNGMVCPVNCSATNCLSKICNIRNGTCNLGCEPGYQGLACRAPVPKVEEVYGSGLIVFIIVAFIGGGLVFLGLSLTLLVVHGKPVTRREEKTKTDKTEPTSAAASGSDSDSSHDPSSPNSSTESSSDADSSEPGNSS